MEAKKADASRPEYQPGLLAPWLAKQGVECVIAGGMGMNDQNLFMNHGVKVAVGALESDQGKAVLAHLKGGLSTDSNICDH